MIIAVLVIFVSLIFCRILFSFPMRIFWSGHETLYTMATGQSSPRIGESFFTILARLFIARCMARVAPVLAKFSRDS